MISHRRPVIAGWTGHRPDFFADTLRARRSVDAAADSLLSRFGSCEFVCGGQRGVDQWAAQAAMHRRIPFHILLPHPLALFTQTWVPEERARLIDLMDAAGSVETIDPDGELGALAYDLRSEAMVRRCQIVSAVWVGLRRGGTFLTICAARSRGLLVEETCLAARIGVDVRGRGV